MRKSIRIPHIIGVLVVSTLLILSFSGCSGQAYAMKGTVDSLSLDGMSMTINGQEVIISSDAKIIGNLAEGTVVNIKYVVQGDGSLIAQEIDVGEGDVDNVDEEDVNDVDEEEEELKVEGLVTAYKEGFSIEVDGQAFSINEDTDIEGTPVVGTSIVDVKYVVQDDDSFLAVEIGVQNDED
jgi:hypothetical protein